MRIGIMQPYFWPYLGYFQLISCVDRFVVYDNIEYTKKGWFNRNRYLCNGEDKYFTIPIAKDSDFLDVKERKIATQFDRNKLKNQIKMAYTKAPYFKEIFPLFCESVDYAENNLFTFIYHSIQQIVQYLEIDTEIVISSTLNVGHEKKGKDKVLEICRQLEADEYVNSIGGQQLYDKEEFEKQGINLFFIQMDNSISYKQYENQFIQGLSILDVMMFNSKEEVQSMLVQYKLI